MGCSVLGVPYGPGLLRAFWSGYEAILHHEIHLCRYFSLYDMSFPGTMDTVAVKVFVKYHRQLQQVVNPSDITDYLFAEGLLTVDERDSAENKIHSPDVRSNELIDAVKKAIHIDSKNLNIFLDIMGAIFKYKPLVDAMRRDLLAGNKRSDGGACTCVVTFIVHITVSMYIDDVYVLIVIQLNCPFFPQLLRILYCHRIMNKEMKKVHVAVVCGMKSKPYGI